MLSRKNWGRAPAHHGKLWRLRSMVAFAMLGAVVAGALGHHEDAVQWGAIVLGSWIGGLVD